MDAAVARSCSVCRVCEANLPLGPTVLPSGQYRSTLRDYRPGAGHQSGHGAGCPGTMRGRLACANGGCWILQTSTMKQQWLSGDAGFVIQGGGETEEKNTPAPRSVHGFGANLCRSISSKSPADTAGAQLDPWALSGTRRRPQGHSADTRKESTFDGEPKKRGSPLSWLRPKPQRPRMESRCS